MAGGLVVDLVDDYLTAGPGAEKQRLGGFGGQVKVPSDFFNREAVVVFKD